MTDQISLSISALLITYFIHSSIFIISALVALRLKVLKPDLKGEYLLKAALILGFVTTGLQHSQLDWAAEDSGFLNWQVQQPHDVYDLAIDNGLLQPTEPPVPSDPLMIKERAHQPWELSDHEPLHSVKQPQVDEKNNVLEFNLTQLWPQLLMFLWLTSAVFLFARKVYHWRTYQQLLKDRNAIKDEKTLSLFSLLKDQANVKHAIRLSECENLDSPIALSRSEVVLPLNFSQEFNHKHLKAALAHELAHIKRYDGHWLWLCTLIESLLFVQPLNRWLNQEIYQFAEQRSDSMAASWTGNPQALAEALSQVAHKKFITNNTTQLVPTMTSKKSNLRTRIENLLVHKSGKNTTSYSIIYASIIVLMVLVMAPGISISKENFSHTVSIDDSGDSSHASKTHTSYRHSMFGRSKLKITSTDENRTLKVKAELSKQFAFNDAETAIAVMKKNDKFKISVDDGDVKKSLKIKSVNGQPQYEYSEDGKPQAYDQQAQTWFANLIPEILRTSGLNAEKRVTRIQQQKGDGAVLDEVLLIESDHTQAEYLKLLFDISQLSDKNIIRALKITEKIGSDFEQAHTISALVSTQNLNTEEQWKVALDATHMIGSDFEHASTLISFIDDLPPSTDINEAYFKAAEKIGSDFEMRRVLEEYVKKVKVQDYKSLKHMFKAARKIGSDFELASLLMHSHDYVSQSDDLFNAYIDLSKSIGSDFEMRRVYSHLLKSPVSERQLNAIISVAQSSIGSDFELASLLQEVIADHALSPEQVSLVKQAAKSIGSEFERNKVYSQLIDHI